MSKLTIGRKAYDNEVFLSADLPLSKFRERLCELQELLADVATFSPYAMDIWAEREPPQTTYQSIYVCHPETFEDVPILSYKEDWFLSSQCLAELYLSGEFGGVP